jgi:hypothetical protein
VQHDPKKAQHFQRKLSNLLTNPSTLKLIDNRAKPQPPQTQLPLR